MRPRGPVIRVLYFSTVTSYMAHASIGVSPVRWHSKAPGDEPGAGHRRGCSHDHPAV